MQAAGLLVTPPDSRDVPVLAPNTSLLPQIQYDHTVYSGEEIQNHHWQIYSFQMERCLQGKILRNEVTFGWHLGAWATLYTYELTCVKATAVQVFLWTSRPSLAFPLMMQ